MSPWWPIGIGAGLTGIGAMFAPNQYQQLRKFYKLYSGMTSPANIGRETDLQYANILRSPMFSTAMGDVYRGGQRAEATAAGLSAGSGISGGLAQAQKALAASSTGFGMGQLRAGAYNQAREDVMRLIQMRLGMLQPGMMSRQDQLLGALFGAGSSLLNNYKWGGK